MTVTLDMLRALLERALTHTDNSAILRLPEGERTVEGVATAYLPRVVWSQRTSDGRIGRNLTRHVVRRLGHLTWYTFDLTDPGTVHALLVALALALGLDPVVGGLGMSWSKRDLGGYILCSRSGNRTFEITAPDDVAGLALAVRHVLGTP